MQKRRLGLTDLDISMIGLGTVKFGRNSNVKYPAPFALPTDNEVRHLLAVSQELGINLLDTAPAYGESEARIGKLLQSQRHEWVISTKVGEQYDGEISTYDFSSIAIRKSIEQSLKRLRTDYLDIVLVHSNGNDREIISQEAVFDTLRECKVAGKIRAFGMSTKTVDGGLLAVAGSDLVMVTLNPETIAERPVIQAAAAGNKGILIKKALGSGHLDPASSLRFVFEMPGVTSVILGTINPEHLRENVAHALAVCAD